MADQAFPQGPESAIAKIGVLVGSVLAAAFGALILTAGPQTRTVSPIAEET
jgi:Na+/H+ antiporter NhaA